MDKIEREIIRSLRQLKNEIKPDPVREAKSREMLFAYFKDNFSKTGSFDFYLYLKPVAVSLLVLFVLIGGFGTVYAAKNTLPGNLLYPVKRAAEKTRMALMFNKSDKAVLRAEILTNRLDEVTILAERVEKGEQEIETHLSALSQDFQDELKVLKQEVVAQAPKEPARIFPAEELLNDRLVEVSEQATLPIQDQRKVFTVIQSEDLKKLLEETKNLLAEKNMEVALEKINDAEKITRTPIVEPVVEEEILPVSDPEEEGLTPKEEVIPKPDFQIDPKPGLQTQDEVIKDKEGSLGSISTDISTGMMRKTPMRIGPIREK